MIRPTDPPPETTRDVRGMLERIRALETELLNCEWAAGGISMRACPCCGTAKDTRHWPTCHLAQLLNRDMSATLSEPRRRTGAEIGEL